jgi:hypothetical protein
VFSTVGPVPIDSILRHLARFERHHTKKKLEGIASTGGEELAALQLLVKYALAHLQLAHTRQQVTERVLSRSLANVAFIPAGNSMITPSDIVVDLVEDVTTDMRAVPAYLSSLDHILTLCGARNSARLDAPRVRVQDEPPAQSMLPLILSQFNVADLADVQFACDGRVVHCHKLVLALVSPVRC